MQVANARYDEIQSSRSLVGIYLAHQVGVGGIRPGMWRYEFMALSSQLPCSPRFLAALGVLPPSVVARLSPPGILQCSDMQNIAASCEFKMWYYQGTLWCAHVGTGPRAGQW